VKIWDALIVGGGIMGSATAIRLAEAGMRVALIEASLLGMGASGVNAGTLSLQIKRVGLMPYALKGHALWKKAGEAVGFRQIGGLTLAFTDREAEMLLERMTARRQAGAPIELIPASQAREREPGLTPKVVLASYCSEDGYANSSLTGTYYRGLLQAAGVNVLERSAVENIDSDGSTVEVRTAGQIFRAARVLLATGAWARAMSSRIGRPLPINVRVNTVSVTERMPRMLNSVIGHASGLLTMKQSANGTTLIGGGWQGRGSPEAGRGEVEPDALIWNLRLAQYALPALGNARLVRAWTGFEAHAPDFYPLAGLMPGANNLYVLCCVRGGYTIGPYIGQLMGDFMLGRDTELPLFDPARFARQEER
jgi:glycine/D-amino acid oxidase-like deaminating enzyme